MNRFVVRLLFCWFALAPAGGAAEELVHSTALEKGLFDDAADGALDTYDLMDAALIASGIPDRKSLTRFKTKYRRIVGRVEDATEGRGSERGRAEAAFAYLHKHVLRSYGLHAVDMVGLFNRGEYNCVSSTILYNAVLADLDIESSGVLVPSHAFAVVTVDGREVEVETTSPHGFAPARTEDEYRKLLEKYRLDGALYETRDGRKVAGAALIKEMAGERQVVSNLTLVAVIYNNLAAARVRDGDLQGALDNFAKASSLARHNERFARNRDALINNLVVDLIEHKEYARAIAAAKAARTVPGLSAEFLGRLDRWRGHAVTRQAMDLNAEGRYQEAVGLYDGALKESPADETLRHNRKATYVQWGLAHMGAGQHREAATVMLQALTLHPDDRVVRKNYLAVVQQYIRATEGAGEPDRALAIARFALAQAEPHLGAYADDQLGPRLHLEVGLQLFRRQSFAEAAEEFAWGLGTGEAIFFANYVAANVNLTQAFLDRGKSLEAWTAISAARAAVGDAEATKHDLWAAWGSALVSYGQSLRSEGKSARALQIVTSAPPESLAAPRNRTIWHAYWQLRTLLLVDSKRFSACARELQKHKETLHDASWYVRRSAQCAP